MKNTIFKFIPKQNDKPPIIHKVLMPEYGEKNHYRHSMSCSAFYSGTRSNATKMDKYYNQHTCSWSPIGLYHYKGSEYNWLEENIMRVKLVSGKRVEINLFDDTKLETVCHNSLYEFYDYIGFDRLKRRYIS